MPAPGDQAALIWTAAHAAHDLPILVDPPAGWLQTTGGVPWTMSLPSLEPADYPAYLAPAAMTDVGQFLREQRSLKTLAAQDRLTYDQMIEAALSTRAELADRILADLIAAARSSGQTTAVQAADVLANWDRQADADSRGMALFALWHHAWVQQSMAKLAAANPLAEVTPALKGSALFFATAWNAQDPLSTPHGLFGPLMAVQALEIAAQQLGDLGLPLDVPWGELARFTRGAVNVAGAGGSGDLGILRGIDFAPGGDGRLAAVGGTAFVVAVEFAEPVRAMTLMPYGNASAPTSGHQSDQLDLAAAGALRPALLTRRAVEENLEMHVVLPQ